MPIKFLKENLKKTTLIISCFIFVFAPYLLAADMVGQDNPEELIALQQQARRYRDEGLRLQRFGNLDSALKLYQKAAELEPTYPDIYNDLGIIYEAQGEPGRAEESYLQALKIDPYFLSAYSNLALLYEGKRDLTNAAYYWKKRVELGQLDDLWTLKAKTRLKDVRLALSRNPMTDLRKNEIVDLIREVNNEKYALKNEDKKIVASTKIKEAKVNYDKKEYAKAIKEALDAEYLDPSNKEVKDFIEKTLAGTMSR